MRVLFLCFATFAVGLLAGVMFWPEDERAAGRGRDVPPPRTEWDRDLRRHADAGGAGGGREDFQDDDASGPGGDLRTLAREAAQEIDRIKSSPTAQQILQGDGTITGTVRDPAGQPVSGVVVTALPQAQPFGVTTERRRARERGHEDRPLSEVAAEAIELELWRRYARTTARTGSDGRFTLDGLMDSEHSLTAFHDDYKVEPLSQRGRVRPDAVVDFLARPAAEVEIALQMPDGSVADYGHVRWSSADGRGNEPWTKDLDTLKLPVGALKLQAQKWVPEPLESAETDVTVSSDAPNERVVLTLEGRRVLTARLVLPEGLVQPQSVDYRLRLLVGGGEDVDPVSLLKEQSQRKAYSRTPGRADWFDLEPGRYLVAAFLERRRLLAHAVADVGEGSAEVELLAEPPTGAHVTVRLLGPDGGPIAGRVSFRVVPDKNESWRNQRVDALQQDDGSWLVYLDGVNTKGDPGAATLRVGTRQGGATHPLNLRGGGTITIRFDEPAVLSLKVDRYVGSPVVGALYGVLRSDLGADGWEAIGADGTCTMRGVQPRDYKLQLIVRKNNRNWVIFSEPLRLRPGDHERTVVVPPLHTLSVRWAGRGRPRIRLRCTDERLGHFRRDARIGDGNVASFDLLAAGTYRLEAGRTRKDVRVPTPEVVLE